MERGHTEKAFHLATGFALTAYAGTEIEAIKSRINSHDEGRKQILACLVRVMENFFDEGGD